MSFRDRRQGEPALEARWSPAVLAALVSVLGIAVAACGGMPATPAAGGSANGGDAAAVAYVDSRYHYRIQAPGRMIAMADGTAAYVGSSERLQVAVVAGVRAADLPTLAGDDVAAFAASAAGFRLVSGPSSVGINGHPVEKFVYGYGGTGAGTGRPVMLVGVRYYVPRAPATVAVITYGVLSDRYDPQGADDIAATFQWQ